MAVRSRWNCAASTPGTLSIRPDAPDLQLYGQPPEKQLNEQITRGKVELSLTVQNVDAADTVVTVNRELARSYQQALRDLSEELCIKNDTSASLIARFPDVLATRHADVDEEQLWRMSLLSRRRRWKRSCRCAPPRVPR